LINVDNFYMLLAGHKCDSRWCHWNFSVT
jgi:hypothetical protein